MSEGRSREVIFSLGHREQTHDLDHSYQPLIREGFPYSLSEFP